MNAAGGTHHPTLGEKAYSRIKNLILTGRIQPGERLLYRRLVASLNISATPIKEAFTRLENDGYVVTIPRKGTFARKFSSLEIREAFEIREMLEGLAARRACAAVNRGALGRMKTINARFTRASQRRDVRACTREDFAFHEMLIHLSGNEKLKVLMKKTDYHLLSIAQSSPRFLQISSEYSSMHSRIIRAMEDRNGKLAERLIREHIRFGLEEVLPSSGA
ncbi:MAG: GntR family transcriptional regulator [Chloroflexi bacterium]|nr:GntR family transcriptional regulator [Chloroflexota bacterium]